MEKRGREGEGEGERGERRERRERERDVIGLSKDRALLAESMKIGLEGFYNMLNSP